MPISAIEGLLSARRALTAYVQTNLRAVTVRSTEPFGLHLKWYFDAPISEDNNEIVGVVETEIESDFYFGSTKHEFELQSELIALKVGDKPHTAPFEQLVFYRYDETFPDLPQSTPNVHPNGYPYVVSTIALLGCITPNVRRVSLAIGTEKSVLRFYIDGAIGEMEHHLANVSAQRLRTLMVKSPEFASSKVVAEVKRVDIPHLLTKDSSKYSVFDRYEDDLIDWAHVTPEQDQEFKQPEHFLP